MRTDLQDLKKKARFAGFLYLLLAITGAYGIMYVPQQIIVSGDANATAQNIINKESLFRTGILSNLTCQVLFIFVALELQRIFKDVDEFLARMMVTLVIVSVPISFIVIFNHMYAILILKENIIQDVTLMNTFTAVFLKMYRYGILILGFFWGLWLIPFGMLVYKSGFMPKVAGILLVIGGIAYVADACAFVALPQIEEVTNMIVSVVSGIGELTIVFWLLIKGVKNRPINAMTASVEA